MKRCLTIRIFLPAVLCGLGWSQAAVEAGTIVSRTESKSSAGGVRPTLAQEQVEGESYVIGPGDILGVNVWKEPDVSRVIPVRSDGKISLPLAGEIQASGLTPKQLEGEITAHLEDYISDPEVAVIVQDIKSQKFNILGQIAKPGSYILTGTTTVLDAIAMTGGFRDFAKRNSIYVLRGRPDGTQQKLPFNYKQVIKGLQPLENVKLEAHDTVIVP